MAKSPKTTQPKRPSIPAKVTAELWLKSGGRCQYGGCNKPLWRNELTMADMDSAYIAHIISWTPTGPRGDEILSPKLAKELSNLMLMCDPCHRLIDDIDVLGHPVERLQEMKRKHEDWIERVTGIHPNLKTEVILYGANIGSTNALLSPQLANSAVIPNRYPASLSGITLSMINSSWQDRDEQFWEIESKQLLRQFSDQAQQRIKLGTVQHFSIFAIDPQPLLVLLGSLLTDIPAAEVFQLQREPDQHWGWLDTPAEFDGYEIVAPQILTGPPALILSLSATITLDRIQAKLGDDFTPWILTIKKPDNNFLQSAEQLSQFRSMLRHVFDRIKAEHGQNTIIHVFPAVPVAVAVEIGRVLQPKADLPLRVYDENKALGGFVKALDINAQAGIEGVVYE